MKKRLSELPLRSGVGIVVLNKQNKVFVAKRIDNPKNFWHYLFFLQQKLYYLYLRQLFLPQFLAVDR